MKKTLLSWSNGKDSAWALHVLRQQPDINVVGLVSTVNQEFDRVAMNGVKNELVQQQAQSAGLPIELLALPYPCSNADYEKIMSDFIKQIKQQGIEYFAFGNLYLKDIRNYREKKLAETGITPLFPLWGETLNTCLKKCSSLGYEQF